MTSFTFRIIFALDKYPLGVYNISNITLEGSFMEESKKTCRCNASECAVCKLKSTPRDESEKKKLINRLNRISGQLNGIKTMIDEDRYCKDVLIQLAAAANALNSLKHEVLSEHMRTCVTEGVKNGNNEIMEEALMLIKKI